MNPFKAIKRSWTRSKALKKARKRVDYLSEVNSQMYVFWSYVQEQYSARRMSYEIYQFVSAACHKTYSDYDFAYRHMQRLRDGGLYFGE